MTNETTAVVKAADNTTPKKEKLTESQKKEKEWIYNIRGHYDRGELSSI